MISGIEPGGQHITTDVENYPGYENPIQGPWLMEQMKKQSEALEQRLLMIMLRMLILVSFLLKLLQKRKNILVTRSLLRQVQRQNGWECLEKMN